MCPGASNARRLTAATLGPVVWGFRSLARFGTTQDGIWVVCSRVSASDRSRMHCTVAWDQCHRGVHLKCHSVLGLHQYLGGWCMSKYHLHSCQYARFPICSMFCISPFSSFNALVYKEKHDSWHVCGFSQTSTCECSSIFWYVTLVCR